MIKWGNTGKSGFETIKIPEALSYGIHSKWTLDCYTLVQWALTRLFPGSRLLEREKKWRKTKATGVGTCGKGTESQEAPFHIFYRFSPRGMNKRLTADTQRPRWGACLHGFTAVQALVYFSFCSHALSTHNMAGTVLISSVALTDFTFLTACEIGTIIIPLSLMLKLRLRDLKEFARVIQQVHDRAGIQACQLGVKPCSVRCTSLCLILHLQGEPFSPLSFVSIFL